MAVTCPESVPDSPRLQFPADVTVFVCANCARRGCAPTSADRPRPDIPRFEWQVSAREILIPCTGRLQPEHVLKAFESGASVVCVVGCRSDNCHYLQGSARCARRADYIRTILNEIGLGADRLMFFQLPGTAVEDMALATGLMPSEAKDDIEGLVLSVRDQVQNTLRNLAPSPLRSTPVVEVVADSYEEMDMSEEEDAE
jgi:F420-non-reducing hydrogenase iron-sulfur subunit